jgi:O-antigen/teichoic acid export membrane protein
MHPPAATLAAQHTARRNLSIRLAVVTSFMSKAGNALLQLLALPLAIRVLGREEYGLFATVGIMLTTISLLQVGVGPALAHGIAQANARGDDPRRRELASTAFVLMAVIAALAGIVFACVLAFVPMPALFGAGYAGREAALRPALWLGLGLFLLVFVLNLTERLREGQLEVAQTNLWGAAGNLLAAAGIGIGVWFVPEVWFLVLAMHGSQVLAKLGNTLALWARHPVLVPALRRFRPAVARHLISDGVAFAVSCLLTGVIEYNLCGWMVGRTGGPGQVALYGVFISLSVMQLGFVIMLTAPTWPAVAEALARGDQGWAAKAARRLRWYGAGMAVCAAAGLVAIGPWVFEVWLGAEFAGTGRALLGCFAFYFAAHVWRHLHHALMIGTGQVVLLARVQLVETTILAGAAWAALHFGSLGAMLLAMGATIFGVTGLLLPRLVNAALGAPAEAAVEPRSTGLKV